MSKAALQKQLKSLDISKLKLKNGNLVEKELKRHAQILTDCILYELDRVYGSYNPKIYERSYDLYNSLEVDQTVHVSISATSSKLSIGLSFNERAMHRSFDGKMVNTAWLINDGWQTHGSFATVPYLGYREATNFISKGIERYRNSVNNPFTVKLTKGTEITHF